MDVLDYNALVSWLGQHVWAQVVLIAIAAYLGTWLGRLLVKPIVHFGVRHRSSDIDESDIKKRRDTMLALSYTLLKTAIWTYALFAALDILHTNFTTLLASAGVISLAVGFGAQSIIKDFISGLFIIFENQYRVGDTVTLGSSTGVVEEITVRSTILRDFDGSVHFIPNGNIGEVINKTLDFSKINLVVKVTSNTNVDRLAEVINKVGQQMAKDEKWARAITQPPQFSNISNFTDSSLEISITGTTLPSKQWSVTNELRKRLLVAFKTHKIELA